MSTPNGFGPSSYESSWEQEFQTFDARDPQQARQSSVANDRRGSEPKGMDSNSEPSGNKGFGAIFVRFAERCSMQGPPYICSSKLVYAKALWVILLLVAMGAMTFHLYYLFQTFLNFPVKNEITLGFSSLEFPAVTVCNVNPIRKSKLDLLSQDFQTLVNELDPEKLEDRIEKRASENGRNQYNIIDGLDFGIDKLNLTDPIEDLEQADYEDLDGWEDSWEKEGDDSTFLTQRRNITERYATEDKEGRIAAGHQLEDMLISCSFAGKSCYAENFTLFTSAQYGNCYTLQYKKFISRKSGPGGGLELILFLETDEYIRSITADSGLQVMVHPQKTMAFPADEGLAIGGGTHTFLSLSLVQVERKGSPYGQCTDNAEFEKKYNVSYTRQTCQKFCEQNTIHNLCKCRDETEEKLNEIMAVESLEPCRNKTEVKCMVQAYWDYQQGKVNCDCANPCTDTKYVKTLSSRLWPHQSFVEVLVKILCYLESASVCQSLQDQQNNTQWQLPENFVKLDIFYEDLNFENITEKPDYEIVQFISDVGGTLGLWIGLSVLGIVEVFQLFMELLGHFCCCRWRNKK